MLPKLIKLQVLVLLVLFVQLFSGTALAASNQLVLTSSQNYQVGKEFAVSYKVDGKDLLAVITKVKYDPSVVSFVRIDNTGTVFPGEIVFTPGSNTLDIVKTTYDFNVATGSSLIATLYFKPIKKGTTQITASGSTADKAGTALGLVSATLPVPIGVSVGPTPAPTTKQNNPGPNSTTPAATDQKTTANTPGTNQSTQSSPTTAGTDQKTSDAVAPDADPQVKALVSKIKAQRGTSPATKQRTVIIGISAFIGILLVVVGFLFWRSRRQAPETEAYAEMPSAGFAPTPAQTTIPVYPQDNSATESYPQPIVITPQAPGPPPPQPVVSQNPVQPVINIPSPPAQPGGQQPIVQTPVQQPSTPPTPQPITPPISQPAAPPVPLVITPTQPTIPAEPHEPQS